MMNETKNINIYINSQGTTSQEMQMNAGSYMLFLLVAVYSKCIY